MSRRFLGLGAFAGLLLMPCAAFAMGYDSLACPELGERRIAYFVENGFCDPAKADAKDCKAIEEGSAEQLPEPALTQVTMIMRTEKRKECPAK